MKSILTVIGLTSTSVLSTIISAYLFEGDSRLVFFGGMLPLLAYYVINTAHICFKEKNL